MNYNSAESKYQPLEVYSLSSTQAVRHSKPLRSQRVSKYAKCKFIMRSATDFEYSKIPRGEAMENSTYVEH